MSDDEIIDLIAEGNITAFEQLYTLSYDKCRIWIPYLDQKLHGLMLVS